MKLLQIQNRPIAKGFSLLELTFVLIVFAVIGLLVWQLLPKMQVVSNPEASAIVELRNAESAVVGFALQMSRLPCPDVNNDGLEDCAQPAAVGLLPQRTLGQLFNQTIKYGVTRNAANNLSVLANTYAPTIPIPINPLLPGPPANLNGLDLCKVLHTAHAPAAGRLNIGATSVPVAFALAHSGAGDADGDGNLFDGLNLGTGFVLPASELTRGYDDYTRAMGIGQLAGRLGCLEILAKANGAARNAFAAKDLYDYVLYYRDFRVFALQGALATVEQAKVGVALAAVALALAVAGGAISIAGAAETLGAAAFAIIMAAAQVIIAGVQLGLAIDALATANAAVTDANTNITVANTLLIQHTTLANEARVRALLVDSRGLLQ